MKRAQILRKLATIFSYPAQDYKQTVSELDTLLNEEEKKLIRPFLKFIEKSDQGQIEERFTYTFDMNPDTCLEIGWHLYGEDYQRGQFLVHLRQSLREYGIQESVELPDHVSHCLLLLSRMDENDSRLFVNHYLKKALEKIEKNMDDTNVYKCLIQLLMTVLSRDVLEKEPVS
jgi:nitrate reductase delta subunit